MIARWPAPRLSWSLPLCLAIAVVVFLRSPSTNFVFDEQEALLANPYVRGEKAWTELLAVDFWGRAPQETIGSYRPLPNLLWRPFGFTLRTHSPFVFHLENLILHALVAALLGRLSFLWAKDRTAAWLTSLSFVVLATSTEVVCSVVGIADVLVALFFVLGVLAITRGGVLGALGVLGCAFFGLLSKETMLAFLPLGCACAALRETSGKRRWLASAGVLLLGSAALIGFVALRRAFFPVARPLLESSLGRVPGLGCGFRAFLEFFRQPELPIDPVNNPLVEVGWPERLPAVARIFGEGLAQLFFPVSPSGDYSFAEEQVGGWGMGSVAGLAVFCGLLLFALAFAARARRGTSKDDLAAQVSGGTNENDLGARPSLDKSEQGLGARRLAALAAFWIPITYLPVSNAIVLLPTIRADRLWYVPALGFCLLFGLGASRLLETRARAGALVGLGFFLTWQAGVGRSHAFDYSSDLSFWRATVRASPKSAKARLNLGVMLGARGKAEERVLWTRSAVEIAPRWSMGQVYLGDALCRAGRLDEAWPHYARGLSLGPNQKNLVALALQCMWDRGAYHDHEAELVELGSEHPGTWLAFLVREVSERGAENGGVPRAYRPRGYNEGTKGQEPRASPEKT